MFRSRAVALTILTITVVVVAGAGIGALGPADRRQMRWRTIERRIRAECEELAAEVCTIADAEPSTDTVDRSSWYRISARAIGLERRATDIALDDLAGALVALRSAVEAKARLDRDVTTPPLMQAAGDDMLVLRCEDLLMSARATGTPRR